MRKIGFLLLAAAVAAAPASEALARKRHTEGTATGARGKKAEVKRDVTAKQGDRAASTTITGEKGRTLDVQRNRDVDPATGVRSATTAVAFPDGTTRSVERTATPTGGGQYVIDREATTRDGEVRTQTGSASVTKTEAGRTVTGSLSGAAGATTFERNVTRQDGVRTVEGAVSGPAGGTHAYQRTTDKATGQSASTRAFTNDQGETRTVATETDRDDDTVTIGRTVTPAEGKPRDSHADLTTKP